MMAAERNWMKINFNFNTAADSPQSTYSQKGKENIITTSERQLAICLWFLEDSFDVSFLKWYCRVVVLMFFLKLYSGDIDKKFQPAPLKKNFNTLRTSTPPFFFSCSATVGFYF